MKKKVKVGFDEKGLPIYKTFYDEEKDSFSEENTIKTKVTNKKKPKAKTKSKTKKK